MGKGIQCLKPVNNLPMTLQYKAYSEWWHWGVENCFDAAAVACDAWGRDYTEGDDASKERLADWEGDVWIYLMCLTVHIGCDV